MQEGDQLMEYFCASGFEFGHADGPHQLPGQYRQSLLLRLASQPLAPNVAKQRQKFGPIKSSPLLH
jgi:hypothetical protein